MKEKLKLYRPLKKAFLAREENKLCKLNLPGCLRIATEVDHTKGRTTHLLNESTWNPACAACNIAVETLGEQAYEMGLKKYRNRA